MVIRQLVSLMDSGLLGVPTPPEVRSIHDETSRRYSCFRFTNQHTTANDPILSKVAQFVMNGWTTTENLPPEFQSLV